MNVWLKYFDWNAWTLLGTFAFAWQWFEVNNCWLQSIDRRKFMIISRCHWRWSQFVIPEDRVTIWITRSLTSRQTTPQDKTSNNINKRIMTESLAFDKIFVFDIKWSRWHSSIIHGILQLLSLCLFRSIGGHLTVRLEASVTRNSLKWLNWQLNCD